MNRRTAISTALAAAVLLAAGSGTASAHAADEVGLSADGVAWSDALRHPLFAAGERWVPGDAQTASFYVRNQGTSAAQLSIEVRGADGADLLGPDDVQIDARTPGSAWLPLENGTASPRLTGRALQAGGQVRVDVRVRFLWLAPNDTMLDRLPLAFEVRLVEDAPGEVRSGGHDAGWLPDTGATVSRLVIWVGAILLGGGLGLLVAARRRREEVGADG